MAIKTLTTHELTGVRAVGGKSGKRRIGKVRSFVFHPCEKRIIGFMVKRPDLLWMFRRKDIFVSLEGYELKDGRVVIENQPSATGRGAYNALGVNPDQCVLWVGLPLMAEDGTTFGVVGDVTFNQRSGVVEGIKADKGATANVLLGTREISADLLKGFRQGVGAALTLTGKEGAEVGEPLYGAILVSDEAKSIEIEGGIAEKAGKATAVVSEKASVAVEKTGKAVNKGAYATGKQISKTKGMFSSFKEEYQKEAKTSKTVSVKQTKTGATNKVSTDKQAGSQARKQVRKTKGMFSSFKEEYNKSYHGDDT